VFLASCVLFVFPQLVLAQQPAASGECNQPTPEPVVRVDLPGRPFFGLATADGCWIFVSMQQGRPALQSGVAVVRRTGGKLTLERVVPLGNSVGMVMTNDGKLLLVTNGDYVDFLDIERLKSGQGDPKVGRIFGGEGVNETNVNVTADDRYMFVSDHAIPKETASVYRLEDARKANFKGDFKVGSLKAGREVLAIVNAPDNRHVYIVSEQATSDSTWPKACPQNVPGKLPLEGIVNVIDVEKAKKDPANSIVSRIKTGCVATRLTLSPKGDRAYVTARADNALVVLDTTKFLSDPENAKIATVPVGTRPTGSTLMDGGSKIIVSNIGNPEQDESLTVIDATKVTSGAGAVIGTIPVGRGPRDATLMRDGKTLFVPNFDSAMLQVIDLSRVQITPKK
jgi:DNA-binding beta-propeller fold protein YncE